MRLLITPRFVPLRHVLDYWNDVVKRLITFTKRGVAETRRGRNEAWANCGEDEISKMQNEAWTKRGVAELRVDEVHGKSVDESLCTQVLLP